MTRKHLSRGGILFCLIGPAGCGKSSLGQMLLTSESGSLVQSVSITSRVMREGEIEGVSYEFISRAAFEERAANGDFVEWEEVHGNLYGTPRDNIDRATRGEIDVLLVIDIKGALNIKRAFPEMTVIAAVLPPSFDDLSRRITGRGSVTALELEARLTTARNEYMLIREMGAKGARLDYLVINGDLDDSFQLVRAILCAERAKFSRIEAESLRDTCKVD